MGDLGWCSINLKKIGEIMKSNSGNKVEELMILLTRNQITDDGLKKEIVIRIQDSIKNNELYLMKLFSYIHSEYIICGGNYKNSDYLFYLERDNGRKGLLFEEKWKDIANKEFCKEELKHTIFNNVFREVTNEHIISNPLLKLLKNENVDYEYRIIGELESKKISEFLSKNFCVKPGCPVLLNLDKIQNVTKLIENYKKIISKIEPDSHHLQPKNLLEHRFTKGHIDLLENAKKYGEDTILELD